MTKTLDERVRTRMAATGQSYEEAARSIGDFLIERAKIAIAIRMWARSYANVEAVEPVAFMEKLAQRIEDGEYEC